MAQNIYLIINSNRHGLRIPFYLYDHIIKFKPDTAFFSFVSIERLSSITFFVKWAK